MIALASNRILELAAPLWKVGRQARSYRLYYPVVRQGYRLRTLGPEAPFVDGVLRIEGILLHPTRCGPASHGTARRTCPITKKSETIDGFVATPSTRTECHWLSEV